MLVRYAKLYEQTTSLSRTVLLAGAYPDFIRPTPLSIRLLIAIFSARFQDFQALQALAGSYSPNALAGTYTLLLQTTRWTSRRDPVHPLLLCIPLRRFGSVSCMPVVYDACAPRLTQSDDVWAFRRASPMSGGGTPADRLYCHFAYRELAPTDNVSGHRRSPH